MPQRELCAASSSAVASGPSAAPIAVASGRRRYTLIATAKLSGIDPEASLADVLRRINDHPAVPLYELLTLELGIAPPNYGGNK